MFDFFEVGGAVRDSLLGQNSKDVDFVAESQCGFRNASDAFNALHTQLLSEGFEVFEIKESFFIIRARVPKTHELHKRTSVADFVLARRDGPSSDGRRPDYVLAGTLFDDLSRRDFTCNAIAKCPHTGTLIDPFNGQKDIENKLLRFVGDPMCRIAEDGLRVLRLFRFCITKGFVIDEQAWKFVYDNQAKIVSRWPESVTEERIREELTKMFSANTLSSIDLLQHFKVIREYIFTQTNLRLLPTSKQF